MIQDRDAETTEKARFGLRVQITTAFIMFSCILALGGWLFDFWHVNPFVTILALVACPFFLAMGKRITAQSESAQGKGRRNV